MRSAVVLNALIDGGWGRPAGGRDTVQLLLDRAGVLAPGDQVYVLVDGRSRRELGGRKGIRELPVESRRERDVLQVMARSLKSCDNIVYLFIDNPLLDVEAARAMVELHERECAEYTCGEGYPSGMIPEILRPGILPRLLALAGRDREISRTSMFDLLSAEINSFDIETQFAPRDLKPRRLHLSTAARRDALLVQRLLERAGPGWGFDRLCEILDAEPVIPRTLPAYLEVELTSETAGACAYSPLPGVTRAGGRMDPDRYRAILEGMVDFAGDLHVSLSLMGEPPLHPDIRRIMEHTVSRGDVHLVLETDGEKFDPGFTDFACTLPPDRFSVIFQVDAVTPRTFSLIHQGDLGRVERNVRYYLSRDRGNAYVQLVRMDCNEEEMIAFFDQWEGEGAQVIIQKYNSYLGLLPGQGSPDMSPLERLPCWHLQRDVAVFHDGLVPRCRQDVNGAYPLGRLPEDPVSTVWREGEPFYREHCSGRYDASCRVCDEYYTYSF
jgi:spiro-SPASM protein